MISINMMMNYEQLMIRNFSQSYPSPHDEFEFYMIFIILNDPLFKQIEVDRTKVIMLEASSSLNRLFYLMY